MFSFFRKKINSKKTAKDRLKNVLSMDRANVSADFLLMLTSDIISTAVKYIEPDYENVNIGIERTKSGNCLYLRMPVNSFRAINY